MMRAKYVLICVGVSAAVFAGVFGALEAKDWVDARHDTNSIFSSNDPGLLRTVSSDSSGAPAATFDFSAASKKVLPSVVSIDRLQNVRNFFFDETGSVQTTGSGSGVILTSDGIIVTNNHVVSGAVEVKVRTPDHHTYQAKVLGTDPRADLAVIKINATGLTPMELGTSSNLEVGQWVLAVGNPLGFDNTVSVGVVSSLKRSLPVENEVLIDAIQTDAAINPGNSGGALADAQGRLIGINAAIASPTQASVGIGFAIPVDRVKEVVSDIVKLGHPRYAGLGISYNPNWGAEFLSDPEVRQELSQLTGSSNIPKSGIIVKSPNRDVPSVDPNGPSYKAGIREWDVITKIDGTPVVDMLTLSQVLTPMKPGQTVTVTYWSRGQTKTAKVTLEELGSSV